MRHEILDELGDRAAARGNARVVIGQKRGDLIGREYHTEFFLQLIGCGAAEALASFHLASRDLAEQAVGNRGAMLVHQDGVIGALAFEDDEDRRCVVLQLHLLGKGLGPVEKQVGEQQVVPARLAAEYRAADLHHVGRDAFFGEARQVPLEQRARDDHWEVLAALLTEVVPDLERCAAIHEHTTDRDVSTSRWEKGDCGVAAQAFDGEGSEHGAKRRIARLVEGQPLGRIVKQLVRFHQFLQGTHCA